MAEEPQVEHVYQAHITNRKCEECGAMPDIVEFVIFKGGGTAVRLYCQDCYYNPQPKKVSPWSQNVQSMEK